MLAYDAELKRIFTINEECEDFTILSKFSGHEYVGRTMKFSNKEEENLILNDGSAITVLTELERGGFYKKFCMEKLTQGKIVDFRIYEDSKLIILDKLGRISIFELFFFDLRFEKLAHLQLGLDTDEMTMSLALCPRDRYLAVSIIVEQTFQQNWIVVLEIEQHDDTRIILKDIKQSHTTKSDSVFYALEIPYYLDEHPVILGCEFEAENKLCSYVFDGVRIEPYKHPYAQFLASKNYRFSMHNGMIWIADSKGTIKRISLLDEKEDCSLI